MGKTTMIITLKMAMISSQETCRCLKSCFFTAKFSGVIPQFDLADQELLDMLEKEYVRLEANT